MRGARHKEFARAMVWIRSRIGLPIDGRPTFLLGLQDSCAQTYGNAAVASARPYLGALEPRLVASPSKVLPARSRTCDRNALTADACCAACRQPTVDGVRGSPERGLDGLW